MKRELKARSFFVGTIVSSGYTACPNEEGTERSNLLADSSFTLSYTACPNEEGTERRATKAFDYTALQLHSMSQWRGNWKWKYPPSLRPLLKLHSMSQWRGNWKCLLFDYAGKKYSVTQHVPMKRELKANFSPRCQRVTLGYTACPNEEGTER